MQLSSFPSFFLAGAISGLLCVTQASVMLQERGNVKKYHFTVSRGVMSPDGYEKQMLLVNGQFPGPKIEANYGDVIEVTVTNNITGPDEGTAMHWHGLSQRGTPYYDGVPGITQCPIAPGCTFEYRFKADSYGTTWYHAHFSAQYSDGIVGPIVINPPKKEEFKYDVDIGPIMLQDYYHRNYTGIVKGVGSNATDFNILAPGSDNNLINGKNSFNCSLSTDGAKCSSNAPLANFTFTPGKVHLLRLINSGPAAMQRFSIDGHKMTVVSNDFTRIVPYETTIVNLGIGQRSEVLVQGLDAPTGSYWMRTTMAANCTKSLNFKANAIVRYKGSSTDPSTLPTTTGYPTAPLEINCANDALNRTVPLVPIAADLTPEVTTTVVLDFTTDTMGNHIWTWNNNTFKADYENPLLLLAKNKMFQSPASAMQNLFDYNNAKSIRIVINNKYQAAHPIHIHGTEMMVLSDGDGYWDGHTIINPSNPQRRDVQMLRRYGHLVLQIQDPNPGVWPIHCHISWHASTGMFMNLLESKSALQKLHINSQIKEGCKSWRAFVARSGTVSEQ